MSVQKNYYSPEFRSQEISLVRDANRPASEVARELDIKVSTLYTWLNPSKKCKTNKVISIDSSSEIKRLKKALAQAELERDILKKAAAYFAKETL